MKTPYIAATLALLAGSAAHAEPILDVFIGGSDARVKVEDCGTDTCGTITLGKQQFVVKKSDISSALKGLDIGDVLSPMKPSAKERGKAPDTTDRSKPAETAPNARYEDRTAPSSQREGEPEYRKEERPRPTAKDAVEQNVAATAPGPAPVASNPKSPIGEWMTEGGEGRVQIHFCGQALCGYVSGANPNDTDRHNPDASKRNRPMNGMPVLIDMKPAKNNHWEGQAYNPMDGRTYSSNISLKSTDVLRVEGCVFGGLFCSGEDWTRVKDAPRG
jgi:uncharacterized protein (DUF2147 family)